MSSRRASEAAGRQWIRDNQERMDDDLQSYAQDLACGATLDADYVYEGMLKEVLMHKKRGKKKPPVRVDVARPKCSCGIIAGEKGDHDVTCLAYQSPARPKLPFTVDMEAKFRADAAALTDADVRLDPRNLWLAGYFAGRVFQHENDRRLLCADCAAGLPIINPTGVPVHEVPKPDDTVWRRTCAAKIILVVAPYKEGAWKIP